MARQWPAVSVGIAFNPGVFTETTAGAATGGAISFTSDRGRQYELGRSEAGTGKLTLENTDGRYTPNNAGSPYAGLLQLYREYRLRATWNAVTYDVARGFIERWPLDYTAAGNFGVTTVDHVDALGVLGGQDLRTAADHEALADAATYLYRLDEEAGSSGAGDSINPGVNPAAIRIDGKYGAATLTFGAATGLIDGSTGVTFGTVYTYQAGDPTAGSSGKVSVLAIADKSRVGPVIPNAAFTIEYWVVMPSTAPVGATPAYIAQHGTDGIIVRGVSLSVQSTGKVSLLVTGGAASANVQSLNGLCDGRLHHLMASVDADLRTTKLYVDGVIQGTTVAGSTMDLSGFVKNHIGGRIFANGIVGDQFPGIVCRAALYPSALSAARVLVHYQAGATAFAGEDSGARITRILGYAGWPTALSDIGVGSSTMGPALIEGTSAIQVIQDVADDELGTLWVSGAGKITFRGRQVRQTTLTPAITFGEDAGGLNNLLSLENFSFEGGTVGTWSGANFGYTSSAIANTTTFAQLGSKALQVTLPTAGAAGAGVFLNVSGLTIGARYTMSVYVRVPAGTPAIRMAEAFGAFSMVPVSGYVGTTTVNNAFQRLACTFVATTATPCIALIANTASTAGQLFVIDGAMLEVAASPSSTGMEIPYLDDVHFDYDPSYVYDEVKVSRDGGATVAVRATTSVLPYHRTLERTLGVSADAEATDQANWLLARYANPALRVAALTIDPGSNPNLWAVALGTEINTRVTVKRRALNQPAFSIDCWVEAISHSITSAGWKTTFLLSPVDAPRMGLWDTDNWDDANAVWGF